MLIYAGLADDIRSDITSRHCAGSVGTSELRQAIANAMQIHLTTGPDVKTVRIDHPEPHIAERIISEYIAGGTWQIIACGSPAQAKALLPYARTQLAPALHCTTADADAAQPGEGDALLARRTEPIACSETAALPQGAGICLFSHPELPQTLDLE